ncbi:hypothetical protein T07_6979 [Trichinella nelsoni]|uniref:Uncharacterized protein n=1 Tax=Trichinella nelsoni TaxID=6336 RepID=A0A0V0RY38_9BILA|nr:hypothetical protein T07_6979 [Trichinella nelsoni]
MSSAKWQTCPEWDMKYLKEVKGDVAFCMSILIMGQFVLHFSCFLKKGCFAPWPKKPPCLQSSISVDILLRGGYCTLNRQSRRTKPR